MTFGLSVWPSNTTNTSIDMQYPSYSNILGSGSKASWVEVIASGAVTADCHWVYVEIAKTNAGSTDTSAVLDIGVDPAGGTSYSVAIADLFCGHTDDNNGNIGTANIRSYAIPLKITSGSSVAIRGQTVLGAAASASVRVQLLGGATGTPFSGSTCVTYGVTGTGGTSVTSGSSTWGSWTNVGSTTGINLQALTLGVQPVAGTVVNRNSYQFQMGVSSAAIGPIYDVHMTTSENYAGPFPVLPAYYYIASGAQLQVRALGNSGGTRDVLRVAIYGVSAT
jgi:hypothetical protein